jgi:transcriptional regulator with XRE-family HTH domain
MTPETEHIIKVLRTAMRVLGYKYQDVEAKLGVAPGYIGRLFRGVMQLRFDHVVEIARAIGLDPEELFQIAFPQPSHPPSVEAQRLRQAAQAFQSASGLPQEPAPAAGTASSIEEETERIERIVLRTFEKFFSSMAKSAAGGE